MLYMLNGDYTYYNNIYLYTEEQNFIYVNIIHITIITPQYLPDASISI